MCGVVIIMSARLGAGADLLGVGLCILGVISLTVATLSLRNASSGGNFMMIVGLQMLVGSVLLFIAVAGSFKSMMVAQFTDSMVGHLQVHRRGYVGAMESLPVDRNMRPRMLVKLYETLDAADGIEAWSPRVKLMAMFSNFANTTSIRLNGIDPARELATVPLVANRVLEGGAVVPLGAAAAPADGRALGMGRVQYASAPLAMMAVTFCCCASEASTTAPSSTAASATL